MNTLIALLALGNVTGSQDPYAFAYPDYVPITQIDVFPRHDGVQELLVQTKLGLDPDEPKGNLDSEVSTTTRSAGKQTVTQTSTLDPSVGTLVLTTRFTVSSADFPSLSLVHHFCQATAIKDVPGKQSQIVEGFWTPALHARHLKAERSRFEIARPTVDKTPHMFGTRVTTQWSVPASLRGCVYQATVTSKFAARERVGRTSFGRVGSSLKVHWAAVVPSSPDIEVMVVFYDRDDQIIGYRWN